MGIGARIQEARKAAGLSREKLAQAVGVTANTIFNWETSRGGPRASALGKIALATGKPIAWFYETDGEAAA